MDLKQGVVFQQTEIYRFGLCSVRPIKILVKVIFVKCVIIIITHCNELTTAIPAVTFALNL